MLPHNYIELAILAAVFFLGLITFLVIRHKAAKYECDLNVKMKSELRGKID